MASPYEACHLFWPVALSCGQQCNDSYIDVHTFTFTQYFIVTYINHCLSSSLCHQYSCIILSLTNHNLAGRLSAAELAAQQMTSTTIQTISSLGQQSGGGMSGGQAGGYSYNIELGSAGGAGGAGSSGGSSSSSTTIRQTTTSSSSRMSSAGGAGGNSSSNQMIIGGGGGGGLALADGEMSDMLSAAAMEGSSTKQSISMSSSKRSTSITDLSNASTAGD